MRTPRVGTLFALAACLILVPATALALPKIGQKHNGYSLTDERYLHVYVDCWHVFKGRCGRNIVDDNLVNGSEPSQARVGRSLSTMERWLHPPAPAPDPVQQASDVPAGYAPITTSTGGCVGMEAESGSAGYSAMSPTGYIGCYQISPDHFAAGGSCAGLGTDPAGQDQCAANICATEGPGAWTNPAGENPCGRLGG